MKNENDIPPTYEVDRHLKSHFLNLYSLALSDLEFDTLELDMLYTIGKRRGISEKQIEEILLHPDSVKFTMPKDVVTRIEYLYDFAHMIWADGKVEENEVQLLKQFINKFEFENENIDMLSKFLITHAQKKTPTEELLSIVEQNL